MSITYTDVFCGAGGSSIGLTEAGPELKLAADEVWRGVPDFPGYTVSSLGQVRGIRGRILRHEIVKGGYHRVSLTANGKSRHRLIHVLVAESFIGPCPDGHEVNHKDGDKDNNTRGNLEYTTPAVNVRHSLEVLGVKRAKGSANGQARLTEDLVRQIRERDVSRRGAKAALAREFGVSQTTIGRAISGARWTHVGVNSR